MDIRPIQTEEDYEKACERIDEIFQAEPGSPEEMELDILVTLVNAYEEKHFPMGKPHPIEAVKMQMEGLGVTREDLMGLLEIGSEGVSDILNCRSALTVGHIRKLSKLLHIPVDVLAQEYELHEVGPSELRIGEVEHQAF